MPGVFASVPPTEAREVIAACRAKRLQEALLKEECLRGR
jgi:hypothetical protein